MQPFILGLVGDSGSGKSTIAKGMISLLGSDRVSELKLDDYQRLTRNERKARGLTALNPAVHNLPLFTEHLQLLKSGASVRNRTYNHEDGSFSAMRIVEPREFVLVRGLLGYPTAELRDSYDLAVFLQPEPELLFRWKLRRDVQSRGYTETEVLSFIARHLLDSKEHVLPQADRADVVVAFELPEWDAPDEAVVTRIRMCRRALGSHLQHLLDGLPEPLTVEQNQDETELLLPADIGEDAAGEWLKKKFPATHDAERVGSFRGEDGELRFRPAMAIVEGVLVALAEGMRG